MKLSILVPCLRPHQTIRLFNSALQACRNYEFEMVFGGPFQLPPRLLSQQNVKFLHTYAPVPVVLQKLTLLAEGTLVHHTVDDGVLQVDSLDKCIEFYDENCRESDIVNCRYREGVNFQDNEKPPHFWKAGTWEDYRLPGINPEWFVCCQPLMSRKFFIDIGGFDCSFEYSNHPHMDFVFRVQKLGGKVFQSPVEVCVASHFPERSGDHSAIHDSQTTVDTEKFRQLYLDKTREIMIDYDNFQLFDKPWLRRFGKGKLPSTYEELCAEQGYQVQGITT